MTVAHSHDTERDVWVKFSRFIGAKVAIANAEELEDWNYVLFTLHKATEYYPDDEAPCERDDCVEHGLPGRLVSTVTFWHNGTGVSDKLPKDLVDEVRDKLVSLMEEAYLHDLIALGQRRAEEMRDAETGSYDGEDDHDDDEDKRKVPKALLKKLTESLRNALGGIAPKVVVSDLDEPNPSGNGKRGVMLGVAQATIKLAQEHAKGDILDCIPLSVTLNWRNGKSDTIGMVAGKVEE